MNLVSPIVAILTPFDEKGRIDFNSLSSYLSYLYNRGIRCIITNGTTGEFPSLTLDERRRVLEHCANFFDGTIINHVSSTCLQDSCELVGHSLEYAQFCLVLPPYYYAHPHTKGVSTFFENILEASALPVFVYNFPLHVQYELKPDLIRDLRERYPQLVGVKDSSGSLEIAQEFLKVDRNLRVFVGSDSNSLSVLQAGLSGSVTGPGNCFPECLVKIKELFKSGMISQAQIIQKLFNEEWNSWQESIDIDEISLAKCALSLRLEGFPLHVRPPIKLLEQEQIEIIRSKTFDFELKLTKIIEQITNERH